MQLSIGLSTKRCSSLRYKVQSKGKSLLRRSGLPYTEKQSLRLKGDVLQLQWAGGGPLGVLSSLLFLSPLPTHPISRAPGTGSGTS
uniref:Matrix metalloproteinase RASI-1 n=1 Tax=Homo sapiens TaxID=9606 RepID=O15277_HUMAN|nr:matrix metalloproteinase RASI-1 [Homo sapiens]